MIGYCAYVMVALLPFYPHSTNQSMFNNNVKQIEPELRAEKSFLRTLSGTLTKALNIPTGAPADIACDKLYKKERQSVCDEAMQHIIAADHGVRTFAAFLDTGSNLAVPPLAATIAPYACKEISIDGFAMKKRMYWCPPRRYSRFRSDRIGYADGFFISSSRQKANRAFIFKQSPTNGLKVALVAKMDYVYLFTKNALRPNLTEDSSSSSRGD